MPDAFDILTPPPAVRAGDAATQPGVRDWFRVIAHFLLGRVRLVAGGARFRVLEVEGYYYGPGHEDPFAHRDELQRASRRWYFHRDGGAFKGGTFKGLDIAIGSDTTFGGVLIRTLQAEDGAIINGPSLLVDRLLAATAHDRVADLNDRVYSLDVADPNSTLHIALADHATDARIWHTARVGLTLRRAASEPTMPQYWLRPYRHLTQPAAIAKGRLQTVVAMHQAGLDADAIRAQAGTTSAFVRDTIDAYQAGLTGSATTADWIGTSADGPDLARALGVWRREYGQSP